MRSGRGNVIGALVSMLACRSHADSGTHQRRGKCDGMTRLDKKGRLGLGATLNQNPRRLKTAGKNRSRGKPPCRRTSRPPQRLALPQHDSYNTPPAGNVKRQKMAPQNAHIIFGEGENRQKNGDQSHVPADISNRSATRSTQCRSMCAIGFDWNMCNMLCSYCVRHASERYGWYHYAERNGRTMHPPQICGTGHMAVSQRQDHGRKHGQGHA